MTDPQRDVEGEELTTKSKVLETGAAMTQDFAPVKSICAHLNAFHVYADDPKRFVEANHYCSHLTEDVRQCILYDSPDPGARLIGIEYMITPKLYATLDAEERRLWHSHVFEVKSGMLVMPQPSALVPQAAWERAEAAEMEDVVELYGKVYHLWQVDKGHKIPLGEPKLMTSFTKAEQMPDFEKVVGERDARFAGVDWKRKKEIREYIKEPEIHPDADATWGPK
ncbi:DUF1264 domain-containing protein [Diaporthe amygdali]|uniref:DUF1264 domain-containing protein n=1 Tax=Phomopsis amygdali TaxID=1214568 RepID=UPI0022FE4ED2|nr:DUF1264 domain-containing protein [Diaporthe amygdali]KAJ0110224.1 DUF1264 domain-containing protein [Diaporthe amygdali]